MRQRGVHILFSLIVALALAPGVHPSTLDSLRAALGSAQGDSQKVALLLQLAGHQLETHPQASLDTLRLAETFLERHPNEQLQAVLCLRYGRYYSFAGQFQKACRFYGRAIQLGEAVGDSATVEDAVNNLAVLQMRLKNYAEGIAAFERLLKMAEARGDSEAMTQYMLNLGLACAEAGHKDRAEVLLRKALARGLRKNFYVAVAANSLSFLNNGAGRFREAERYARKALAKHPEESSRLLWVHASTNLANALVGQGRFADALPIIRQALRSAREKRFEHEEMELLRALARAYEGLGRYVEALGFFKQYSVRRDSLLTRENARQINELMVKYETAKKEQQIALRTQQLRVTRLKLRFSLVILLLVGASGLVVTNLYLKRTAAYKELVKRNLELMRSEERISDLEKEAGPAAGKTAGSRSGMSDRTREKLVKELNRLFREERVYLRPDLTLEKLASQMGVSSRYISEAVHEHYGSSFPALVNSLRVSEARRMLADESYRHYSIEGIARSVGFSSKSAFNVAFKRITGLTPSFFRESVGKVVRPGD